eukprot:1731284-Pleurochrysis_carterae.AAC.2
MGRLTELELARWILRGCIRHVARLWHIPSRRVRVAAMVGPIPWWRRLRLPSLCTDPTCPPGSWCGVPPPSSSPTEASTTGARRMGLATSPITGLVTVALASRVPGGSRA